MSLGQCYAGIDAGGTSTRCVVADGRGSILGSGQAGPGNALIAGHDQALAAYRGALAAASDARQPDHLHIAAGGTHVPPGAESLAAVVTSGNDAPAAFAGALLHGPGVIAIAGTGSAVYGESATGQGLLLGGWGPLAGDEGSGYAIGRAALRHLARVLDGRLPPDALSESLLRRLQAADSRAVQERLYRPPMAREAVAALAVLVGEAATRGDAVARAILGQATGDLAGSIADAARLLRLGAGERRIALLGGVWRAGEVALCPFVEQLAALLPGAEVLPARYPPVIGALLLCYRQAGVCVDETLLKHLDQAVTGFSLD